MINIQLGEEQLPRVQYEKDGIARDITVDHNTLFEFISQNCFVDKAKQRYTVPVFETPALPPGTVKYIALPDGKIVLFMEQRQFKQDLKYHNDVFKKVPFPNLLFVFMFTPKGDGYVMTTKRCFAFKDKVFRDTTELYRFPFSHVTNSGDMCYFFTSTVKDLAQMSSYIYNWYTAQFTDHYYNTTNKNLWGTSLREIFMTTQGKPFDYSKLIKEKELTASALVSSLIKPYC